MHTYLCLYDFSISMHAYICICPLFVSACIHVCGFVCMFVCTYICVLVCLCITMRVSLCVCVCATLGLYGERIGALNIVCADKEQTAKVVSQVSIYIYICSMYTIYIYIWLSILCVLCGYGVGWVVIQV